MATLQWFNTLLLWQAILFLCNFTCGAPVLGSNNISHQLEEHSTYQIQSIFRDRRDVDIQPEAQNVTNSDPNNEDLADFSEAIAIEVSGNKDEEKVNLNNEEGYEMGDIETENSSEYGNNNHENLKDTDKNKKSHGTKKPVEEESEHILSIIEENRFNEKDSGQSEEQSSDTKEISAINSTENSKSLEPLTDTERSENDKAYKQHDEVATLHQDHNDNFDELKKLNMEESVEDINSNVNILEKDENINASIEQTESPNSQFVTSGYDASHLGSSMPLSENMVKDAHNISNNDSDDQGKEENSVRSHETNVKDDHRIEDGMGSDRALEDGHHSAHDVDTDANNNNTEEKNEKDDQGEEIVTEPKENVIHKQDNTKQSENSEQSIGHADDDDLNYESEVLNENIVDTDFINEYKEAHGTEDEHSPLVSNHSSEVKVTHDSEDVINAQNHNSNEEKKEIDHIDSSEPSDEEFLPVEDKTQNKDRPMSDELNEEKQEGNSLVENSNDNIDGSGSGADSINVDIKTEENEAGKYPEENNEDSDDENEHHEEIFNPELPGADNADKSDLSTELHISNKNEETKIQEDHVEDKHNVSLKDHENDTVPLPENLEKENVNSKEITYDAALPLTKDVLTKAGDLEESEDRQSEEISTSLENHENHVNLDAISGSLNETRIPSENNEGKKTEESAEQENQHESLPESDEKVVAVSIKQEESAKPMLQNNTDEDSNVQDSEEKIVNDNENKAAHLDGEDSEEEDKTSEDEDKTSEDEDKTSEDNSKSDHTKTDMKTDEDHEEKQEIGHGMFTSDKNSSLENDEDSNSDKHIEGDVSKVDENKHKDDVEDKEGVDTLEPNSSDKDEETSDHRKDGAEHTAVNVENEDVKTTGSKDSNSAEEEANTGTENNQREAGKTLHTVEKTSTENKKEEGKEEEGTLLAHNLENGDEDEEEYEYEYENEDEINTDNSGTMNNKSETEASTNAEHHEAGNSKDDNDKDGDLDENEELVDSESHENEDGSVDSNRNDNRSENNSDSKIQNIILIDEDDGKEMKTNFNDWFATLTSPMHPEEELSSHPGRPIEADNHIVLSSTTEVGVPSENILNIVDENDNVQNFREAKKVWEEDSEEKEDTTEADLGITDNEEDENDEEDIFGGWPWDSEKENSKTDSHANDSDSSHHTEGSGKIEEENRSFLYPVTEAPMEEDRSNKLTESGVVPDADVEHTSEISLEPDETSETFLQHEENTFIKNSDTDDHNTFLHKQSETENTHKTKNNSVPYKQNIVIKSNPGDSVNELGLDSQSNNSDSEPQHSSVGSYIVLGAIMCIIIVLLGYSVIRSRRQRQAGKREDDFGTEMKDIEKKLLPFNGNGKMHTEEKLEEVEESKTKLLSHSEQKEIENADDDSKNIEIVINNDSIAKDSLEQTEVDLEQNYNQNGISNNAERKSRSMEGKTHNSDSEHVVQINMNKSPTQIARERFFNMSSITPQQTNGLNKTSEATIEKIPASNMSSTNGFANTNGQEAVNGQVSDDSFHHTPKLKVQEIIDNDSIPKKPVIINKDTNGIPC